MLALYFLLAHKISSRKVKCILEWLDLTVSASGHVILLLWFPNICVRLWADISPTAPNGFKRPITVGKVDWVVNGVCIFICELMCVRRVQRKMANVLFCHRLPYSLEMESLPEPGAHHLWPRCLVSKPQHWDYRLSCLATPGFLWR